MRFACAVLFLTLPACTSLDERLDEPDVAIPPDCTTGTTEIEIAGTVVDFVTGEAVAGARIDVTETWSSERSFPTTGCRLGGTTTDASGHYGPLRVRALDPDPIAVVLVTGAGRAPTIADASIGCLFGCSPRVLDIVAPAQPVADTWRRDLYAGGMEYALNRGLVAYTFHDASGPAARVAPTHRKDLLFDEPHVLEAGAEVQFLEADRRTLADPERTTTASAGVALIATETDPRSYYRVGGERGSERWSSVGVISATGWIYIESDSVDPAD